MSNGPVDKFSDYPASVDIFERQNDKGKWYTADVSKTYKDGEEYKKTRNFNRNDLLKLSALLPQAITRMQELDQAQHRAQANGMEGVKQDAQKHLNGQSQAAQQEGQTP